MQNLKQVLIPVAILILILAVYFATKKPVETNTPINNIEMEKETNTETEKTKTEAQVGNTVAVHYVGKLEDGTEFDNSLLRGAPISFTIGSGGLIPGFENGVVGMKIGERKTIVIPPEFAYGEIGIPGVIPPNATLIFEVEMVQIQ